MIEACRLIMDFSDVDKAAFDASVEKQSAIIHQFLVLGEAASRVTEPFRSRHPDVPWHQAAGMRNRLLHDYIAVDSDMVWQTAKDNIPALLAQLEQIPV